MWANGGHILAAAGFFKEFDTVSYPDTGLSKVSQALTWCLIFAQEPAEMPLHVSQKERWSILESLIADSQFMNYDLPLFS